MNKLTKYACILTTLAGAVACSGGKKAQGDYAIIPLPQEVVTQGSAPLSTSTIFPFPSRTNMLRIAKMHPFCLSLG